MTQIENSFWHQLLECKVSRHKAIDTAVLAGATASLPITISPAEAAPNNGAPFKGAYGGISSRPPFRATRDTDTDADALTLPQGYSHQILAP